MKNIVTSFMLSLFTFVALAQNPYLTEYIIVVTPALMDHFQINYPGCSEIEGSDVVELDFDITSLNGLSTVSFIGRDLKILYDFSMHSLIGLAGMTYVEGKLHLVSNTVLYKLATIEKMASSGGYIDLS